MSSRHLRGQLVYGNVYIMTEAGDLNTATSTDATLVNAGVIIVNKDSGAATGITINTPDPTTINQAIRIVDGKGDAATNNITITPESGNINGAATYVISENYGAVELIFDGTNWTAISTSNSISDTELGFLDGVTAGTGAASKAVVLNSSGDYFGPNGGGMVIGHTAQETVSAGDGSTDLVPELQLLGTAKADASLLLASFSTTATRAAAPTLALAKGGNAAIGSHTIVTDGEVCGCVTAYADDGVDLETPVGSIEFVVDDAGGPGANAIGGSIEIFTTADGGTTLTQAMSIDSSQQVLVGASGVAQSLLDVRAAAGSAGTLTLSTAETTNVDGDVLGRINFQAPLDAAGTDAILVSAAIWAEADATFSASVNTTDIVLATGTSEAATEKWRITADGELTSLGAAPANVAADGAVLASGGNAFTDVLNAWIDDATHGSGTTTTYIGNETITTSSDSRVKKNISPYGGNALAALEKGPELVEFDYNLPGGGGNPGESDYGPNMRGRYVGFIAQETIDWAPWVVNAGAGKDCPTCRAGKKCDNPEHPIWHVNYEHLVPLLVQSIRDLNAEVKELRAKVG